MNTIIVVVDPQKGWLNDYTRPPLLTLAEALNQSGCWQSVVITKFVNDLKSPFRTLLPWWRDFQTSADTDFIDEFANSDVKVFERNIYGLPAELWIYIERQGVKQLMLTGVETDATIVKTAMDAFDRGISVWVPSDLVASTYGPVGQSHGLAILGKVLGKDHILSLPETRGLLASC